ncbi:MAG: nickel pincer cofactor biosynthesis protein LarB [Litorilinea sp.]
MNEESLRGLLARVAAGEADVESAIAALRTLPFEDMGFATLDHHRALRWGFPEVIFCEHKTPEQVAAIAARLADHGPRVLGTRATPEQYAAAHALLPQLQYHAQARCLWLDRTPDAPRHAGVVIAAAGTSDLPVVEEAAITLELMGHAPRRIVDIGVAGLHRLAPHVGTLQTANVVVVIAGMEGALASVVGGLTNAPVIAVPTSVGYGASFNGLAALLAMLNSCASGVAVVNIDNGYGAGHMAALINGRIVAGEAKAQTGIGPGAENHAENGDIATHPPLR